MYRYRSPYTIATKRADIDIVVLLCLQTGEREVLTGNQGIFYHNSRRFIRTVHHRVDRHIGCKHGELPQVIIRTAAPRQINGVRRIIGLDEIIGIDTRRIFQFDIIDEYFAIHLQATDTGSDGDIIVCQLIVRENETCFLEVRTADIERIKRHEGTLDGNILHCTDIQNAGR